MGTLLAQYQESPRLLELAGRLSIAQRIQENDIQKIFLKNLQGSSAEFIVSAVFMQPSCQNLN
ncbi:MAG: hypothetical protein ABL870_06145, partial [Sediminibacterium sp.]